MSWLSLVIFIFLSVLQTKVTGHVCSIDKPGVSKPRSYEMVLDNMEPCFRLAITENMILAMKNPNNDEIRNFFKQFCPKHREVTSCMANVRSSLTPCHNRNVSVPFMIWSHLAENLLTVGCEQDGEQLAVMVRGYISLKENRQQLHTLRNCFYKTIAVFMMTDDADIDLTSESYMTYKEMPMLKRCLIHVHDESFKNATEWWIDEIISSFRCVDPIKDTLVLCSSINDSLVNMSNICELKPHNPDSLYDQLEDEAIDCFSFVHSHELRVGTNYGDLDWLVEDYRRMCQIHRDSLDCLLKKAGFAEACLAPAEEKQFHVFMESLDEFIKMGCLEDGRKVANIMHEVYRLKGSPNSNITNCFKSNVAKRVDATTDKNLRFYQDVTSFKSCVVEELKENEPIVKELETIMDNLLGKMRCVNPNDGSIGLCKTIHINRRR